MAHHHCDISSKEAVSLGCDGAEMDPANPYKVQRNTASIKKDLVCDYCMHFLNNCICRRRCKTNNPTIAIRCKAVDIFATQ